VVVISDEKQKASHQAVTLASHPISLSRYGQPRQNPDERLFTVVGLEGHATENQWFRRNLIVNHIIREKSYKSTTLA